MRAWCDIRSFEAVNRQVDEAGIESSCATVRRLIEAKNQRGIPTSNIFLAGSSQGAAMTCSAGLRHPAALAGLIVMSSDVPSQGFIDSRLSATNLSTPIFARCRSATPHCLDRCVYACAGPLGHLRPADRAE
jgi:phospholipase/carboxylesterase